MNGPSITGDFPAVLAWGALVGLAACSIVDVWLYSSLTARWRAVAEARDDWIGRALQCRLCLSFHATWALAFLMNIHAGPTIVAVLAAYQIALVAHAFKDVEG